MKLALFASEAWLLGILTSSINTFGRQFVTI